MALRERKRFDQSNRPMSEFELTDGSTKRDTWMAPFCKEGELQIRIYKAPATVQGQYRGAMVVNQPKKG